MKYHLMIAIPLGMVLSTLVSDLPEQASEQCNIADTPVVVEKQRSANQVNSKPAVAQQPAASQSPAEPEQAPNTEHKILTLSAGQSFIALLKPYGMSERQVFNLQKLMAPEVNLSQLPIGQKIKIGITEGKLSSITLATGFAQRLNVSMTDQWHKRFYQLDTYQSEAVHDVAITQSLYESLVDDSVPLDVINQTITVFSHFVDFQREIHQGDALTMMYDKAILSVKDGLQQQLEKAGQLKFARLQNQGEDLAVYHHHIEGEQSGFYFVDGRPAQSFLLKTPLNGARLSSTFGSRKHPILGYTRLHAGLDFGAPVGTPIFAAGNGTIKKAGWGGGFGNRIVIRHANGYDTLYAHLNGFAKGVKPGTRVRQGEVIGYLGNTGLSQARHLHYEVHKHGKPINPLSLRHVKQRRLAGSMLAGLQQTIARVHQNPELNQYVSAMSVAE
ncbi:peptidoglycan DD-metalloendopeptidase family protein [Pseudoalteromonas ardens]|uniref:peptidoglycan DD-metalloendopeptidase family protein n=1 Tax=Pseudoalteromonas ardens TaxID=3048490 RepID=UPI0024C3C23B|nr:peptidoglycan DD-metalloendopeptidase family protein [Pseudoalteromonas sp. R96]MDK1310534.1 peptidoglycan DD-metalloendopeptidase family protein [Pseudoalteromonas sp. R96]